MEGRSRGSLQVFDAEWGGIFSEEVAWDWKRVFSGSWVCYGDSDEGCFRVRLVICMARRLVKEKDHPLIFEVPKTLLWTGIFFDIFV
jgi:hypothetical protein